MSDLARGPDRHYRLGATTIFRTGWTRWGAIRNGRGVDNLRTPLGAIVAQRRWERSDRVFALERAAREATRDE